MSTATTLRASIDNGIASLTTFFASDRVAAARHVTGEVWWRLRPAVYFAVRVAALTLVLGFSRWADLDTLRMDISESDTSWPTLLTVIDAFDSVLRAAEAVGSSITAANAALGFAALATAFTVVLTASSIMVSPMSTSSPSLKRSMAWFPRRLVREIFAVMIACAILARAAGEPSYLFNLDVWSTTALLALVTGLTILAEQRWMATSTTFISDANLPIGAAVPAPSVSPGFSQNVADIPAAASGMGSWVVRGGGSLDPLAGGVAGRGAVDPEETR